MKKWLIISVLCSALLLGGCNKANEGENPKQPNGVENGNNEEPVEQELGKAAEDEFTSKFLVSTEEEEEGFYRMRGELGGFEMLIPRDALISDLHETVNSKVETLFYILNDDSERKRYDVQVIYRSQYPEELKQGYLDSFKKRNGIR